MSQVLVSNSYVSTNPDIPVKVTVDSGANVQHMIIDGLSPSITVGNLSNYTSSALEASKIVSAVPCKLFVISGFSTLASDQYIHIFNSATLPANGTKPDIVLYASAGSTFGYTSPALYGRYFSTGLVICNSTTLATKTLGAANVSFDIQYL
jgi:hypothetical protein